MKQLYFKSIALLLFASFAFSACLKKGDDSYDVNRINDVTVDSTFKDSYIVNVGDTLRLNGQASQSKPDSKLSYEWYYYTDVATPVSVGKETKLALPLDMPTGIYTLVFKVTDEASQTSTFKKINLTVKKLTSEGWLILTNDTNGPNFSIVSSEGDIYKNFLKRSPEFQNIGSAVNFEAFNNSYVSKIQPITLTTTTDLYFIDHNTFEVHSTANEAFKVVTDKDIIKFGNDEYSLGFYMIDSDGKVYFSKNTAQVDANFPSGFDLPCTGTYKATDVILGSLGGNPVAALFYDDLGKQFLYQRANASALTAFGAAPASAPFSMSNFTDKIIYSGIGDNSLTYLVGKSGSGIFNVYTMALTNPLSAYPARAKTELDIPAGAAAKLFTVSPKLPLLYYINGQSLYVYKVSERKSTLLYTFPPTETLVDLKMLRGSQLISEDQLPTLNNRIAIAANEGSDGILYTFDLTPTGAVKGAKYTDRINGFAPIVKIQYKQKPD